MKILILQIDITKGYIEYNHPSPSPWDRKERIRRNIENVFQPSVQSWAKKMSYDYIRIDYHNADYVKAFGNLYREPTQETKLIGDDELHCLTRFSCLDLDYDYILYLDNDIYVHDKCEEFPFKPGISICKDQPFPNNYGKNLKSLAKTQGDTWYSCGVFSVDRTTGIHFKNYVLSLMEKKILFNNFKYPGKIDQLYTNIYCNNNLDILNELDITWNNIVNLKTSVKNPNFAHYAGTNKIIKMD